ncbi:DUF4435 domain-containing protein [Pantoea sp. Ap-870]|uniref:DUF4435 domain-containing protein n=1 Tax=Pantoea sp. Ap-870 TaxID=2608358 RepID=UPI00141A1362|nr:DUF4435 domain-containing protein [Pantoea sp. Ap-870]NIE52281.1 DUF4435 domain-containing protein [Pantoea sp. Ap-870]
MMDFHNMNRVEAMDLMTQDESVIFREYLKKVGKSNNMLILLLEGQDDLDYYQSIFNANIGLHNDVWIELVCHGRDNVIKLIDDISTHTMKEYRDGFYYGFIDKDYHEVDENDNNERIYITPTYSIENFYVSLSFFKKVLSRKFYLIANDEFNKDFETCCDNFVARIEEFIQGIKELDVYLRCNRLMFKNNNDNIRINARDIKLDNLFSISLDTVVVKSDALTVLGKKIEDFDNIALASSYEYYEGQSNIELSKVIRGKFMFYFIHKYLFRLKEDNRKKNPCLFVDSYALSKKTDDTKRVFNKTKISVYKDHEDILSDLCQFADVPSCLITFLSRIRSNFFGGAFISP